MSIHTYACIPCVNTLYTTCLRTWNGVEKCSMPHNPSRFARCVSCAPSSAPPPAALNPFFDGKAALSAKAAEAAATSQEVVEELLERTRKVGAVCIWMCRGLWGIPGAATIEQERAPGCD